MESDRRSAGFRFLTDANARLLLRDENPEGGSPRSGAVDERAPRLDERWRRCRVCNLAVARERDRIAMLGALEHTFLNPGGHVYRIACYAEASGVTQLGEPTLEWTWFPGYAWCVALCRGCAHHLGWEYRGEGKQRGTFFGLISEELR